MYDDFCIEFCCVFVQIMLFCYTLVHASQWFTPSMNKSLHWCVADLEIYPSPAKCIKCIPFEVFYANPTGGRPLKKTQKLETYGQSKVWKSMGYLTEPAVSSNPHLCSCTTNDVSIIFAQYPYQGYNDIVLLK